MTHVDSTDVTKPDGACKETPSVVRATDAHTEGCAQVDMCSNSEKNEHLEGQVFDQICKEAPPRGALLELYNKSNDPRIHQLRDKGWCVIEQALSPETVQSLINDFNDELRSYGYCAQFGDHKTTQFAKNFPGHFWSIDTVLLPLQQTSVRMRMLMVQKMASLCNVHSTTLAVSFDGTMCAASNTTGKAGVLQLGPEGHPVEMPCVTAADGSPNGPTHLDQMRTRESTCESNQAFCTLTTASYAEYSTVLFVPTEKWTLQGVRELLARQFPAFYDAKHPYNHPDALKKRKRDMKSASSFEQSTVTNLDLGTEGHKIPKEHCDFLLHHGVCRVVKPILKPGDMIIWSSFMFHCGACYDVPGISRGPRLGLICAFAPTNLISLEAQAIRFLCIGKGKTTGQQILYPKEHPLSTPHCARVSKDKKPQAYLMIDQWRQDLKTSPLWMDRPSDTTEMKAYRTDLRQLLGMNDILYKRFKDIVMTIKPNVKEWKKALEALNTPEIVFKAK